MGTAPLLSGMQAALVELTHKVSYEVDPESGFLKFRSGEVFVKLVNGSTVAR